MPASLEVENEPDEQQPGGERDRQSDADRAADSVHTAIVRPATSGCSGYDMADRRHVILTPTRHMASYRHRRAAAVASLSCDVPGSATSGDVGPRRRLRHLGLDVAPPLQLWRCLATSRRTMFSLREADRPTEALHEHQIGNPELARALDTPVVSRKALPQACADWQASLCEATRWHSQAESARREPSEPITSEEH